MELGYHSEDLGLALYSLTFTIGALPSTGILKPDLDGNVGGKLGTSQEYAKCCSYGHKTAYAGIIYSVRTAQIMIFSVQINLEWKSFYFLGKKKAKGKYGICSAQIKPFN